MPLNEIRALVRRELHDEDAQNYRWSDNELNRHLQRAIEEYQLAWPREGSYLLNAAAGVREYDLSAASELMWPEKVWWPYESDELPPKYVPYRVWGGSLRLLGKEAPKAGDQIRVLYARRHTLTTESSSIPLEHEHIIVMGAAGYAALEWANYAIGRVNVSDRTPQQYWEWGAARLGEFRAKLGELRAQWAARGESRVAWEWEGL